MTNKKVEIIVTEKFIEHKRALKLCELIDKYDEEGYEVNISVLE